MIKAELTKPNIKTETVHLKVYIHCEGCTKKVKKILNNIDGVQTIVIDPNIGKVTVTGTVDSKTLIKKLEKGGKYAELWTNSQIGGGKGNQQSYVKDNKETKEGRGGNAEVGSNGGNVGHGVNGGSNQVGGNNGGGGKKNSGKKGGTGGIGFATQGGGVGSGGGGGGVSEEAIEMGSKSVNSKSLAPKPKVSYGSGQPLESAEYATHMFSDENANNCSIM